MARRIVKNARTELLRESIREELLPPANTTRFPMVTVIICTRDRPDKLARCLKSVVALDAATSGCPPAFEILVVDNAPTDGATREAVNAMSRVQYVCEPRPGLNFARNRAMREASGEILAYLDDDVVVDGGWLTSLLAAWADNQDAAAFTGLVLPLQLSTRAQILFECRGGFRRGFRRIRYQGQDLPGNPLYPCGAGIFGTGANMAFRRDVLLRIGGFDEALDTGPPLPGGGDLDIFYRMVRAGYPLVYDPGYLVFHEHRRDMDALGRQYRSWGLGLMAFISKSCRTDHPRRSRFRRLIRWWFLDQLRQLLGSIRGRHAVPAGMLLAEILGGIVGLCGEYGRSLRRTGRIRRWGS